MKICYFFFFQGMESNEGLSDKERDPVLDKLYLVSVLLVFETVLESDHV